MKRRIPNFLNYLKSEYKKYEDRQFREGMRDYLNKCCVEAKGLKDSQINYSIVKEADLKIINNIGFQAYNLDDTAESESQFKKHDICKNSITHLKSLSEISKPKNIDEKIKNFLKKPSYECLIKLLKDVCFQHEILEKVRNDIESLEKMLKEGMKKNLDKLFEVIKNKEEIKFLHKDYSDDWDKIEKNFDSEEYSSEKLKNEFNQLKEKICKNLKVEDFKIFQKCHQTLKSSCGKIQDFMKNKKRSDYMNELEEPKNYGEIAEIDSLILTAYGNLKVFYDNFRDHYDQSYLKIHLESLLEYVKTYRNFRNHELWRSKVNRDDVIYIMGYSCMETIKCLEKERTNESKRSWNGEIYFVDENQSQPLHIIANKNQRVNLDSTYEIGMPLAFKNLLHAINISDPVNVVLKKQIADDLYERGAIVSMKSNQGTPSEIALQNEEYEFAKHLYELEKGGINKSYMIKVLNSIKLSQVKLLKKLGEDGKLFDFVHCPLFPFLFDHYEDIQVGDFIKISNIFRDCDGLNIKNRCKKNDETILHKIFSSSYKKEMEEWLTDNIELIKDLFKEKNKKGSICFHLACENNSDINWIYFLLKKCSYLSFTENDNKKTPWEIFFDASNLEHIRKIREIFIEKTWKGKCLNFSEKNKKEMIYKTKKYIFRIPIELDLNMSKCLLKTADISSFKVFSKDGIKVNFLGRIRPLRYEQESNGTQKTLINAKDFLDYSPYRYEFLKNLLKS